MPMMMATVMMCWLTLKSPSGLALIRWMIRYFGCSNLSAAGLAQVL
jgi:hypothetical protein